MEVNTPYMDPMGFETTVNVCGHQHPLLGESVIFFVLFRSWLVLSGWEKGPSKVSLRLERPYTDLYGVTIREDSDFKSFVCWVNWVDTLLIQKKSCAAPPT